jgi:predicted RNase H-like HicB family nuclease
MEENERYLKIVEWSDEDQCFVGRCPELFSGGCHGMEKAQVYEELCQNVEEWIEILKQDGKPLPLSAAEQNIAETLKAY